MLLFPSLIFVVVISTAYGLLSVCLFYIKDKLKQKLQDKIKITRDIKIICGTPIIRRDKDRLNKNKYFTERERKKKMRLYYNLTSYGI